jgi:coproporphyrinogen III oxidase-like Fe-S oxidoreductase
VGDHVSLYQLTIEPDTPYAALHAAGKLIVPDPDAALALYEITQEMTSAKGLAAYEVSNHALSGAESRHNLLYWRYGEYAGIGPGAHGRLCATSPPPNLAEPSSAWRWARPGGGDSVTAESGDHSSALPFRTSPTATPGIPPTSNPSPQGGGGLVRIATVAERNPEAWAARVEERGCGYVEQTLLTPGEQADEMLLMGLRLSEGIDLTRLAHIGGVRPSAAAIAELRELGLIEVLVGEGADMREGEGQDEGACAPPAARIRATPRGRFVLNAVVAKLSQSFEPAQGAGTMDKSPAAH